MTANLLEMNKWGTGTFTFVLGMLVVFLGMLIIVAFVSLMGVIMKAKDKKAEEKKAKATEATSKQVAENVAPVDDGDIPEHVRVAIIAAISAYYESEQPQNSFTVRKIKKLR